MSDMIVKPFDIVQSIEGTEWHRKADHLQVINRETAAPLHFPILHSVASHFTLNDGTELSGEETGDKTLFADLRSRKLGIIPLSTMGEDYCQIGNLELWESMERAFSAVGCKFKVTTVGTLDKCRKYFISIQLEGHEGMTAGGDQIASFINFITSHDGTYSIKAYDSHIRIVCMNTFRWSLSSAGNVGFDVKHTKNAAAQFENLEAFIQDLLSGRDVLKATLDSLSAMPCTIEDAENIAKGYLATVNKVPRGMELSTRSKNAAFELINLFQVGTGNRGETLADLWNAGTEYWTHGDGVGKQSASSVKVCKSAFGMAAEHKDQWLASLKERDKRESLASYGKQFKSVYA